MATESSGLAPVPALQEQSRADLAPPSVVNAWQKWRFLLWLMLPFSFYLLPLLLGFSWSALGEGHNVLNPPEGYSGRLPDMRITVEAWGASVVVVPFHAKLAHYIAAHELPLWNPYQGLGQPFAAQGEGSPYFPFAVIRALLPYSLDNYVTFFVFYISSVFLYLFLREWDISEEAAVFGGIAYTLSGALSFQIARFNIADQICMIPVLFWAASKALRKPTINWYVVFAFVAALHLLAGFIQIAMITAVLVVTFCVICVWWSTTNLRDWLRQSSMMVGVFVLGNGLGAFSLLQMAQAESTSYGKDVPLLSFGRMPLANAVAMFFPLLFGQPFKGSWLPGIPPWVQGVAPWVVDWDNLYAFAGIALLLVAAAACSSLLIRQLRYKMYLFFFVSGIALLLRYISVAPIAAVNLLPVLGRESPKHSSGLIVFCFVIAAAFSADYVMSWESRRARWLILAICVYFASVVLTFVGQQGSQVGGFSAIKPVDAAVLFLSVSVSLTLAVLCVLWMTTRSGTLSKRSRIILLGTAVVSELTVYIPLGNSSPEFLYTRLGIFALLLLSGICLAVNIRWAATALFLGSLGVYAFIVYTPKVGLPRQFNVDSPPRFVQWLKAATGQQYRTFGIAPDFSDIADIQDISAVGPLAPLEFLRFVSIISDQTTYQDYQETIHFMLAGPWHFNLDQYLRVKPIFDWVGVRYLALDHAYFSPGTRTDDQLLIGNDQFRTPYKDDRVTVVESMGAEPKAIMSSAVTVLPNQQSILQTLSKDPQRILGEPLVEASDFPASAINLTSSQNMTSPVSVTSYRPNHVQLEVDAPWPGLVVLKDSYAPGWQASINGMAARVVRVDGMVRGVIVDHPGHYVIDFLYRPLPFIRGVWVSSVILLLLGVTLTYGQVTHRSTVPRWALAAASLLVLTFLGFSVEAYFGVDPLARLIHAFHRDEQRLSASSALGALYLPPGVKVAAGAEAMRSDGTSRPLLQGNVILDGASGKLLRLEPDGRAALLTGEDGQRVHISNVGPWDSAKGGLSGLEAVDQDGHWVIDSSVVKPSNENSDFQASTADQPLSGFWVSPADAGYTATLMHDDNGPFVRIQATTTGSYLAVTGQGPLASLQGAPVTLGAEVLTHGSGKVRLTVYDVVGPNGQNKTYTSEGGVPNKWSVFTLRVPRIEYPDPADNFSLGLYDVHAGDSFDVRWLRLDIGVLP